MTKLLHMCFDRFLLAFESCDLSQADKSIIRVSSFPSVVISSRTYFSVFQQLRPKLSAKWILSILSNLLFTRKTETDVYFFFWMMKLTKISNCQSPIRCFSITVSIIVQKLKFCKIKIEYTHITLLSAWNRSRDSTAKRTLSKQMWRSKDFLNLTLLYFKIDLNPL